MRNNVIDTIQHTPSSRLRTPRTKKWIFHQDYKSFCSTLKKIWFYWFLIVFSFFSYLFYMYFFFILGVVHKLRKVFWGFCVRFCISPPPSHVIISYFRNFFIYNIIRYIQRNILLCRLKYLHSRQLLYYKIKFVFKTDFFPASADFFNNP